MLYVGLGWIGSQTICTARAPLSGANKVNGTLFHFHPDVNMPQLAMTTATPLHCRYTQQAVLERVQAEP